MPSIKELRVICHGSNHAPAGGSQSLFGYHVIRSVSIYVTWIFIRLPFTPNQITSFAVLVFLVGAGLFAADSYPLGIIGMGLIVLEAILDGVDGGVARYRKMQGGIGGDFVEPVSHDIKYGLMFLPMGWGATHATGNPLFIVFGAMAGLTKVLYRLLELRFRVGVPVVGMEATTPRPGTFVPTGFLYRLYRNLFTSSGIIPPLILASVADRIPLYVLFYGVTFPLLWLHLLWKQYRRIVRAHPRDTAPDRPVTA